MVTGTLELFNNCKYDIYRNISNFENLESQESYYNSLNKISKSVTFNKIGDPFIVENDISELLPYSYGRVQYQNKWYYFQVNDLAVNAQGRTIISYTVDAWETMRYQYTIKLGAGQIERIGVLDVSNRITPPYSPRIKHLTDSTIKIEDIGYRPAVFAMYRDNTNDWVYPICLPIIKDAKNAYLVNVSALAKYIMDAMKTKIENGEILGMWYSSFSPLMNTWVPTDTNNVYYYNTLGEKTSIYHFQNVVGCSEAVDSKISNTDTKKIIVVDERGNIVYQLSDGISYNFDMQMILNMSLTSASWECYLTSEDNSATNFQIPCEPLDYYVDSWQIYQSTQRQTDIDTRNLAMNQSLTSSLGSIGATAVTGAALGSVVPGIGTAIGAIGGAVVGAVGSLAGYAGSAYNSPKQQKILDTSYKNDRDQISLCGNGVNSALMAWLNPTDSDFSAFGAGFKTITYDSYTTNLIDNDITTYGYYCDIVTNDVDSYIVNGPFKAECEVIGCPASFGAQIQDRLRNGVVFK